MIVVGMISGTSMDGLDVAACDLDGAATGALTLRPIAARTWPWPASLRSRLMALLPPGGTTVEEVAQLDELVGRECGRAAAALIASIGGADLVVSHGQTVFHWVSPEGRAQGTLQLGQPAPIVEATGLPVVSDVRARDIAAGGQGAPLAGTLDTLWLRGLGGGAALNLGGIANVTIVPAAPSSSADSASRHDIHSDKGGGLHYRPGEAVAFDTGPASCLIDAAVTRITGGQQAYDVDGRLAASGAVRQDLLDLMLAEPYYALEPPKSTGRELFTLPYVDRFVAQVPAVTDADLIATLTELTARTVADALVSQGISRLIVSGGGVHNPVLMKRLRARLPGVEVGPSDAYGLSADDKEAHLMALIGYLTWHQVPGVLPGMTGSHEPRVLGRISLGDKPVRLPEPGVGPRSLTVSD